MIITQKSAITFLITMLLVLSISTGCLGVAGLNLTNKANAMKFSWPVILGRIVIHPNSHNYSENALPSSDDRTFYDFGSSDSKQIVRVYLAGNEMRIGDPDNPENAIAVEAISAVTIYEMSGEDNRAFYIVDYSSAAGGSGLEIIGKDRAGRFVQCVGMDKFRSLYNDPQNNPLGNQYFLSRNGDTIFLSCRKTVWDRQNGSRSVIGNWQYIMKWDTARQQFETTYKQL